MIPCWASVHKRRRCLERCLRSFLKLIYIIPKLPRRESKPKLAGSSATKPSQRSRLDKGGRSEPIFKAFCRLRRCNFFFC